jgi:hypothetical protein
MTNGSTFDGRMFIDASYEGDLMAAAGVSYAVGREALERYDEPLAGIRFVDHAREVAEFDGRRTVEAPVEVCPYEDGRVLPGVGTPDGLVPGAADRKPMVYNFRVTASPGTPPKFRAYRGAARGWKLSPARLALGSG